MGFRLYVVHKSPEVRFYVLATQKYERNKEKEMPKHLLNFCPSTHTCMNMRRWNGYIEDGRRIFRLASLYRPPANGCSLNGRCNRCKPLHAHPLRNARYLRRADR